MFWQRTRQMDTRDGYWEANATYVSGVYSIGFDFTFTRDKRRLNGIDLEVQLLGGFAYLRWTRKLGAE